MSTKQIKENLKELRSKRDSYQAIVNNSSSRLFKLKEAQSILEECDSEISLDKEMKHYQHLVDKNREIVDELNPIIVSTSETLNVLEKEESMSILGDRSEENNKHHINSIKWHTEQMKNPKSVDAYVHHRTMKRQAELNVAFSIMPNCSSMGGNELSKDNAIKFIEEKRST